MVITLTVKKIILALLGSALILSAAGCSGNNTSRTDAESAGQTQSARTDDQQRDAQSEQAGDSGANVDGNILIAYFTVPETDGTDTSASASRVADGGEVYGNTQYIAQLIQESVGGDLFAIRTVAEYPGTHDELLDYAYNELRDDARPELESRIDNLANYDVIFIGYPNWNSELPMPMYTFFEEHDFSGKTIVPFVTHGGSGFSRTIRTIEELEPDANVVSDGLSISRNNVANARDDVAEWARSLEL